MCLALCPPVSRDVVIVPRIVDYLALVFRLASRQSCILAAAPVAALGASNSTAVARGRHLRARRSIGGSASYKGLQKVRMLSAHARRSSHHITTRKLEMPPSQSRLYFEDTVTAN